MPNDPFDNLERQLRGTITRRTTKPATGRRRSTLAIALAALIGGGSLATAAVLHNDRPSDVDRAVAAGYRAAHNAKACDFIRPSSKDPLPMIAGGANARIRSSYEIFRRPTTAQDRTLDVRFAQAGGAVLRDTVRVAVAADGARFGLAISQGRPNAAQRDPVACATTARDAAVASVPPSNTKLREHVAKVMNGRLAAARRNSAPSAQQLSMSTASRFNRSSSAGTTLIKDGRIPAIGGYRFDRNGSRTYRVHSGLVPDKVRTVTLVARRRDAPPLFLSQRVQNNVYDLTVPAHRVTHVILRWKAVDGGVLKTIHPY